MYATSQSGQVTPRFTLKHGRIVSQNTVGGSVTVQWDSSYNIGFDLGNDAVNNVLIGNQSYAASQYNGNISGMAWKSAHDNKVRKYDFVDDAADRLNTANFNQYVSQVFTSSPVNYSVSGLGYDANGNILEMNQDGLKAGGTSAIIDQLTYNYQPGSNKLSSVPDAAPVDSAEHLGDFQNGVNTGDDYTYDANGNMASDATKKITAIIYNSLNLPEVIRVGGKGSIYYSYDATGNKLRKRTVDSTSLPAKTVVTTYINNGVYLNDTLQLFGTTEGRVRPVGTIFVNDYFLKDHLGNTRMVITDDYSVSSPILEASSYYPFGLMQKGIGMTASGSLHNYKNTFLKQERNEDFGVDIYEFKYRMDDPQIGRFWQIDPLADDYTYNSPYAFSKNKIIGDIELEGLEAKDAKKGIAITTGVTTATTSGRLIQVSEAFGPLVLFLEFRLRQ
ncbi:MAG TPA: hypothetical protein VL053_08780 [Arachidicoccus sp.]|nr:hypothetical protein [Arachidicoccus sp.]